MNQNYPRCRELGIPVHEEVLEHVLPLELNRAVGEKLGGPGGVKKFHQMFGIQTGAVIGGKAALYAWEVEAVLERMMSGRLTGSQKHWD